MSKVAVLDEILLRGAVLVHLTSAILLSERGISLTFVSSDLRLINAAESFQIKTLNPMS